MHLLLSDVLAPWGQAAAVILAIYLFINILVGLVFAVVFVFLLAWVRQKTELIKQLRPTVDVVNQAIVSPQEVAPEGALQQKLVQAVQSVQVLEIPGKLESVQHQVQSVGEKVDQQASRVAGAMIEIHARSEMVKGTLKALFLPGLAKPASKRIAAQPAPALQEAPASGEKAPVIEDSPTDERQLVKASL